MGSPGAGQFKINELESVSFGEGCCALKDLNPLLTGLPQRPFERNGRTSGIPTLLCLACAENRRHSNAPPQLLAGRLGSLIGRD